MSNNYVMSRILDRLEKVDDCWLYTGGTNGKGYGVMTVYVHRVMFVDTNGPLPDGHEVAHICDQPNCVNPDHLMAMTHGQNVTDSHTKGRNNSFGWRGRAKLTEDDVRAIRRRVAAGERRVAMAEEFGVSLANIDSIVWRKSWRHVD